MDMLRLSLVAVVLLVFTGCATVTPPPTPVEAPVTQVEQQEAQKEAALPEVKTYKRKIAIARFTNESRYGKSLLRDGDLDPLGKQASDMLMSRLVSSGNFIVLERTDIVKIEREQAITGTEGLVGSDVLIVGSVTEFGRVNTGKTGFLSATKKQTARAKVDIRLVDVRNGHAFFSASGVGEAQMETGQVAGFGNRASYDATLNDRAIAAAISDMLSAIVSKLDERPWRSDILKIKGNMVFISGGKYQGVNVGDELLVMREGEKIESGSSGFSVDLPPTKVGSLRVVSLFGSSEVNEGAVCKITGGSLKSGSKKGLFVSEK